ncbi:molybdenum cofactor guanylyltransferase MobA [Microvirga brassicacearum]|uniref:Molybdenum cofactor guanylyltransferase n=1 Tax=Microvirga brassicacearum TaxID=2580413 RepID=A0A5N3P3U9_9HYPH|nr:molybdenum cofactor guanylyltransferase MobA [Microvirga brassicacearum]
MILIPTPPTVCVLLAGGLARRLGGGDKPMRKIGDRTMLERIIARLQPQCTELILNANGDPGRFSSTGLRVVPDDVPGSPGPLAGILAGLDWAHRSQAEWVVSVATDTPFLPLDFVARLHDARLAAGFPICQAVSGDRTHPVNALWAVSLREDLRYALVVEGVRKVERWAARHGVARAEWPTEPFDPFFNVNTPEDLALAEALARRHGA